MGFFGKLGNFAEDAASFAVPAATTFGLSALSAGTLNPGTLAILGSLGAGAGGFANNEAEERARKFQRNQRKDVEAAEARNKQAVGRSNLINALNPRAGARPHLETEINTKMPKPGFLETLARGTSQGVNTAQNVMTAVQAAKLAQAQLDNLRARTGLTNAQAKILGDAKPKTTGSASDILTPNEARNMGGDLAKTGSTSVRMDGVWERAPFGDEEKKAAFQGEWFTEQIPGQETVSIDQLPDSPGGVALKGGYLDQISKMDEPRRLAMAAAMDPTFYENASAEQKGMIGTFLVTNGGGDLLSDIAKRTLDTSSQQAFEDYKNAADGLIDLRETLLETTDLVGPVTGRISALDPETRQRFARLASKYLLFAQGLGKELQGRMTDFDFKIIQDIVGDPNTTVETLLGNMQALEESLMRTGGNLVERLESGNFRIPDALSQTMGTLEDGSIESIMQKLMQAQALQEPETPPNAPSRTPRVFQERSDNLRDRGSNLWDLLGRAQLNPMRS